MTRFRVVALLLILAAGPLTPTDGLAADRTLQLAMQGNGMTPVAESILRDIRQATWIRDGHSKKVIYVFFDPNCPYCRRVYEGLRPQVEFGEVELRWIPVGILMATSAGKAAALLEAADPVAAFHENENRFTTETGAFGGVGEEPAPKAETTERLARNLELLRRGGRQAVPSLVFRDRRGEARFVRGAPSMSALAAIVKDLGG